jgi:hypothetical protein
MQLPKNTRIRPGHQVAIAYTHFTMITVPMTEAQFASATRRLADNGIVLTGREGTLTKDGITATYTYNGEALSIDVTDRPSFLPLSMIEGRLQAYLDQSIAADKDREQA